MRGIKSEKRIMPSGGGNGRKLVCFLLSLILLLSSSPAFAENEEHILFEGGGMFQAGSFSGPQEAASDAFLEPREQSLNAADSDAAVPMLLCASSAPSREERLYEDILDAMQNCDIQSYTFDISGVSTVMDAVKLDISAYDYQNTDADENTVYFLYAKAVNSHPRWFYFVPAVVFVSSQDRLSEFYLQINPTAYSRRDVYEQELAAMLAEAVPDARGMSETEIALAVHDYLVLHTRYDWDTYFDIWHRYENHPGAFSAYGAIVDKRAVCQGLSLAYMDMLSRLGMQCAVVASYSLGHAWNLVCADGGWYHADITNAQPQFLGDPDGDMDLLGQVKHDCFMLSDEESRSAHHGTWDDGGLPASPAPHPDSAFWGGIDSPMFFCGGYWYYNSGSYKAARRLSEGELQKSAFGASRAPERLLAASSFPARFADELFLYDYEADSLAVFDLAGGTIKARALCPGEKPAEMGFGAIAPDDGTPVPRGYLYYVDSLSRALLFCAGEALGDVDGSGGANVRDALLCAREAVSGSDEKARARGDLNWDTKVDGKDAEALCAYIVRLIVSIPA